MVICMVQVKTLVLITSRLPLLTEVGGRVNRVGFSRTMIEIFVNQFGFFYEWTRDFVDLTLTHLHYLVCIQKLLLLLNKFEDMIQIDLLSVTLLYSGTATRC